MNYQDLGYAPGYDPNAPIKPAGGGPSYTQFNPTGIGDWKTAFDKGQSDAWMKQYDSQYDKWQNTPQAGYTADSWKNLINSFRPIPLTSGGSNQITQSQPFGSSPVASPAGGGYIPGGVGGEIDPGVRNIPYKTPRPGGFAPVGINPNRLPGYNSLPSYGSRPVAGGALGGTGSLDMNMLPNQGGAPFAANGTTIGGGTLPNMAGLESMNQGAGGMPNGMESMNQAQSFNPGMYTGQGQMNQYSPNAGVGLQDPNSVNPTGVISRKNMSPLANYGRGQNQSFYS